MNTAVTVTVQELHRLFDTPLGRCVVVEPCNIPGLRWIRGERPCRRQAEHVVLVRCHQHGRNQRPVCTQHLEMLKLVPHRITLQCTGCNDVAVWLDRTSGFDE